MTHEATLSERNSEIQPQDFLDIRDLLSANEITREQFEITTVGEAGYIIRLGEVPPIPGNDWVMYDLDDTLIAYSEAKPARLAAYAQYLERTGITLDASTVSSVMDATDDFSRWPEDGIDMYHIDAHKDALAWATNQLRDIRPDKISNTLDTIKSQLQNAQDTAASNPLSTAGSSIRLQEGRLTTPELEPVTEQLDSVFDAMIKPRRYSDALEAMVEVGKNVNSGIFTYGEPSFQLLKVLEVMRAQIADGKPLPVSHIWLTKVPKGVFLNELANLKESAESAVVEEILGGEPHVVMLVDDSPKEINNFEQNGYQLSQESQLAFGGLRTARENTKNYRASSPAARIFYEKRTEDFGSLKNYIYFKLQKDLGRTLRSCFERPLHPEVTDRVAERRRIYGKLEEATSDELVAGFRDQQDRKELGVSRGDIESQIRQWYKIPKARPIPQEYVDDWIKTMPKERSSLQ